MYSMRLIVHVRHVRWSIVTASTVTPALVCCVWTDIFWRPMDHVLHVLSIAVNAQTRLIVHSVHLGTIYREISVSHVIIHVRLAAMVQHVRVASWVHIYLQLIVCLVTRLVLNVREVRLIVRPVMLDFISMDRDVTSVVVNVNHVPIRFFV